PVQREAERTPDLDGEDGQRDREPGTAVEDVVEEAVARVVVVRAIAPEAALLEEIPREQAGGFVRREAGRELRAEPRGQQVEGLQGGRRVEIGMPDPRD